METRSNLKFTGSRLITVLNNSDFESPTGAEAAEPLAALTQQVVSLMNCVLEIQYLDPWRACTLFLLLRRLTNGHCVTSTSM